MGTYRVLIFGLFSSRVLTFGFFFGCGVKISSRGGKISGVVLWVKISSRVIISGVFFWVDSWGVKFSSY